MAKAFVFTRYLYENEEVEIALMLSLLHKKEEQALFWAYELYYSGFQKGLIDFIWTIYYDFYATMNPGFQTYLLKKTTSKNFEDPQTLGTIIQNFLIRPFNLDVFMLNQIQKYFVIPKKENNAPIRNLLNERSLDYEYLLHLIFEEGDLGNLDKNLSILFDDNNKTIKNLEKIKAKIDGVHNYKIILLANILHLYGVKQNIKMGKNIYIQCEVDEFKKYETLEVVFTPKENKKSPTLPAYQILPLTTTHNAINEDKFLSLFELKREKGDINQAYLNQWLYYASHSPIWLQRIQAYRGKRNEQTQKIVFENDEMEEEFYQKYGYEPDEQKKEVQEKSIGKISKQEISDFYKQYNSKGFFVIDDDYLEC